MYKKLTFIIILILSFGIISCFMQNSFKLKIDSYEYVITANNINDTFEVTINNNTYDMTPLIYASYSGNLSLAKFSIEKGADVNAKYIYSDTALSIAAENGNFDMVKYLVGKGASGINQALITASERENWEIAKYLIEHGADINTVGSGKTALIIASEKGNFDMVKYLVEKGVDINAFYDWDGISAFDDWCGISALMMASDFGYLEIVKYLVKNGANVNAKSKYGDTALGIASERENWEIAKYLIEHGADINTEDSGETALITASGTGNFDMVKYLIEKGASGINQALITASGTGNFDMVKYLVENGADINTEDSGETALITASGTGNFDIVKYLIEKGADINSSNNTALIIASGTGNFDMVKYLVGKGADINAFDDWEGISALMMASDFGYLEIVKYLVENGANINAKDNNGWTALMYASTMGYSQIVKYLIEKGANKETESVNSQEPKLVEKYLFATLKGKIDGKHDITINIQISDVNSLTNGATAELTGNYHYDKFGKNIYFTKGTINKNSMIIEAGGDEVFTFKLEEATLNKILEFKNITINGTWKNKSKNFTCVINSIAPLGGKLSEIYKYNISGEASYDRGYGFKPTFEYYGDALYSPSMNVSYLSGTFYFDTNVDKVDIKTLKNIMKGNCKKSISDDNDGGVSSRQFSNDCRIRYFDNKILCLEEYKYSFWERSSVKYNYTILSLETGKKLNNNFDLYTDLVDYSGEFAEFFKKEFIEYHDYREHYEERYTPKPSYYKGYYLSTPFIFNNDGTITIYNAGAAPEAARHLKVVKIEKKKLKPYIKKDSFYRYLFD